jgi:hypothetical protein
VGAQGTGSRRWLRNIPAGITVLERLSTIAPTTTRLLPNYPNPLNPEMWAPFGLSEDADVAVTIYDALGWVVRRINLGQQAAGVYGAQTRAAYWDGRNARGEPMASGAYFAELTAGKHRETRRVVLLK